MVARGAKDSLPLEQADRPAAGVRVAATSTLARCEHLPADGVVNSQRRSATGSRASATCQRQVGLSEEEQVVRFTGRQRQDTTVAAASETLLERGQLLAGYQALAVLIAFLKGQEDTNPHVRRDEQEGHVHLPVILGVLDADGEDLSVAERLRTAGRRGHRLETGGSGLEEFEVHARGCLERFVGASVAVTDVRGIRGRETDQVPGAGDPRQGAAEFARCVWQEEGSPATPERLGDRFVAPGSGPLVSRATPVAGKIAA